MCLVNFNRFLSVSRNLKKAQLRSAHPVCSTPNLLCFETQSTLALVCSCFSLRVALSGITDT